VQRRLRTHGDPGRARDCLSRTPSSSGWHRPSSPWRRHAGRSSKKSLPWGTRDPSPGLGIWPPPISPTSERVWWGARHGRVVTNAVRAPVRPATRGMRVVSRASARVIAGRMVVSRRASLDFPTPGGPSSRTLGSERPHSVHPNMQRSMTCQPMSLLPRRRGEHGSPRSTRRGQREQTQVFGHGSQLAMNETFFQTCA
jgi:hypothetical protein